MIKKRFLSFIYEKNDTFVIFMIEKIWRVLTQILYYHNDSSQVIKSFFENLHNDNMNDEKYFPLLKTFSKFQIKALYQNGIIKKEKFDLLEQEFLYTINKKEEFEGFPSYYNFLSNLWKENPGNKQYGNQIEEIISTDNVKELQALLQEKNIKAFNKIIISYKESYKMAFPLIQYCIMKKALKCFKYLLVNGYDDPRKVMEEQNPYSTNDISYSSWKSHPYEWDCMTTAIFCGNKEIIKILEEKGFEKGNNPAHLEAAILSYRNGIVKELLEIMKTNNNNIEKNLENALIYSAINNNIKGAELLIQNGANLNIKTIILSKDNSIFCN